MIGDVSIVVLTPTKNEDWILENFLQITSMFADHILLADQQSTDNTRKIIASFDKAVLVENDTNQYDEEYRQILLINTARALVPGKKLFIAIDADEIITYNSIHSEEWKQICNLPLGTRVFFKKPDILPNFNQFYNYGDYFLLGFLDDGRMHTGRKFHSPRVPFSEMAYNSQSITFMHLNLIRETEERAKIRLYSIIECIEQKSNLIVRLRIYSRLCRYSQWFKNIEKIPNDWITPFENYKVFLNKFYTSQSNNYNKRILNAFNEFGSKKFWFEDIWYVDYEKINSICENICTKPIQYPPLYINFIRIILIRLAFFRKLIRDYINNQKKLKAK